MRLPDRAGVPEATEKTGALETFGREIGLAFQLLDDVLDVTGPPERTGKARGTDLLDGTVTLPLILARERDDSLAELDLRSLDAAGAEAVCERIAATGVLEEVRAGARRRVELAKRALELERPRAPSGASSWSWSPRASSSAIPRRLEVLGKDLVRLEGGREAVDLVLHVGADQDVEIVEHRLGAAVERLVQAVDDLLAVAAAAVPLAFGAAEGDMPLALARRRPVGGVDEVRVAGGADVQVVVASRAWRSRGGSRRCWARGRARATAAVRVALGCLPLCHYGWSYRRSTPDALGTRPQGGASAVSRRRAATACGRE